MSGGHESGFNKSEDDLEELVSYWDTDITFEFKKGIKEVSLDTFIEMSDYYNKGYKVISMGIPINSMIASITETDIIDPSDAGKANPSTIFNRDYVNYNPIIVKGMKEFRDFEVFPVYHPLFFIGTKMLGGLFGIISRIQKYIDMDPRESCKNATHSRNLEELKSFVERYRTDIMAFDVETNFVSPYDKGFEIVGFSISFDGQNGTYVNLRECQDKDLILEELVNLLDNSKKVLIHNIKMELPALLNYLDYKLPYEKVVDTLVKSKLINSGRTGSNGLKEQAVIRLGYSDWSVDVDRIQSYEENLYNQYAKMKRSKGEKVYNLDSYEQAEIPEGMKELISKYYGIEEVDEVLDDLKSSMFDCARNLTDEYWNSFGLIPNRILSRYGAIDAIATWDLNSLYEKMFKKLSVRFNIELDKGYDLWMESMYASYILELNSCRWDEAQAKLDEDTYLETMKEDLIALLRSDHKSVRDLCKDYISRDVVKSYMETKGKELIESNSKFECYTGTGKIRYRGEDGKLKNVAPDKYQDLISIFDIDLNVLHIEIETYLEKFLNKGIYNLDHSELSSILNVNSDAGKKIIMELLEDEITCSTNFLLHLISHTTTEKFQIEKANKMYSEDELKFIDFVCTYDQNWKPNKKLEWYEEVMDKLVDLKMETTMSDMVSRSANWRMSTVDEANMTELFNLFKMAGYDIDNDHDNDDAFSRLFHLRRYKKVNKLLTTYINGTSLGRSQVKVVDKDTFQDGRKMTRRGRSLDGKPIRDNEDYLFQGSWNANSVLSGRWSSGIHCLAGDTKIKSLGRTDLTIEEMYRKYMSGEEQYVISVTRNLDWVVAKVKYVLHSGDVNKVAKVHLDNGEVITCTTNHRFLGRDNTYYEAKDLEGISLMPYYENIDNEGRRCVENLKGKGKSQLYKLSKSYIMNRDGIENDYNLVAHHIDKDRLNDEVDNLEIITRSEHLLKHAEVSSAGGKGNKGKILSKERKLQMSKIQKSSRFNVERRAEMIRRNSDKDYQEKCRAWQKTEEGKTRMSENFKRINKEIINSNKKILEMRSKAVSSRNDKGIMADGRCKASLRRAYDMLGDSLNWSTYESVRVSIKGSLSSTIKSRLGDLTAEEMIHIAETYNHKVVKVEIIDLEEPIPVYDLSINEDTPCFVLASGVVSHNTIPAWSDQKRYLAPPFKGGCSVIMDFSQAEIRVVATAANETNLLNAYANGIDVHMVTAMGIFKKPASEINETERRFSKMGTFHIIYGGDPEGFAANNLNGDVAEAQKIFDGFFSTYPALKVWQQGKNDEVKRTGYVTSMTNRFTFLGYEAPGVDVNKIVRQSGNVPIQGPSSDIAAGAIFNIIKFTEEKNMRSQMYCFVHDSIEANVPPDELFYMIESFQYQMNTYPRVTFGVSTKSDVTIGASLGEEVEVKYYKPDEDYKGGVLELEGHTDEVERLLQRWSEFWDVIDITIYERKYSMMSYKDLFAVKRSYTKRIGKMNGDMKLRVRLRYDKGEGCKIPWITESLFPQVDPIIRSTIVPRYRSGSVDIILTDGLKGRYVNGGTEQDFEFKSKEEMKDYFKKYNFVQIEGYEIKG